MNIVSKKLSELNYAPYNPRKKLQEGDKEYEKLKRSIQEFGYVDPLIYNKQTGYLVGGHQRKTVLEDLGFTEVPVVEIDIPTDKEKALNIALNKISGEWDMDLLKDLLSDLEFNSFDMELTGFDLEEIDEIVGRYLEGDGEEEPEDWDKYTGKIEIPQYQITGDKPDIKDLVDIKKTRELIDEIEKADIPKEDKDFLRSASFRHLTFNYRLIAEYYAHAPKEIQELMEKSALVIIDYNSAIANGYANLKAEIREMWEEDYPNEE